MAIGAILPIYSLLLVLNSQDGFAEERGDWISREGPKTFIMFNISRTEEFCGLNTDFVEFDELVADYTDIINKAVLSVKGEVVQLSNCRTKLQNSQIPGCCALKELSISFCENSELMEIELIKMQAMKHKIRNGPAFTSR